MRKTTERAVLMALTALTASGWANRSAEVRRSPEHPTVPPQSAALIDLTEDRGMLTDVLGEISRHLVLPEPRIYILLSGPVTMALYGQESDGDSPAWVEARYHEITRYMGGKVDFLEGLVVGMVDTDDEEVSDA